jgi:hypothetical protein
VFSIDTGTSKVTADNTEDDMDNSKDCDSSEESTNDTKQADTVAIKGMGLLAGNADKHEEAASKEDKDSIMGEQDETQDNEFSTAGKELSQRMDKLSEDLINCSVSDEEGYTTPIDPLSSDKEGKSYREEDHTVQSGDEELGTASYNSSVTECWYY